MQHGALDPSARNPDSSSNLVWKNIRLLAGGGATVYRTFEMLVNTDV